MENIFCTIAEESVVLWGTEPFRTTSLKHGTDLHYISYWHSLCFLIRNFCSYFYIIQ